MKRCCCFAKAEFPERGSLPTLCLIKTDLLSFVVVCCCELNVNKDSIKNATSKLDLIDLHRRTLQRCTVNPLRSVHPRISQEGANEGFSFFLPLLLRLPYGVQRESSSLNSSDSIIREKKASFVAYILACLICT